jgi:hypothetical protein
VAVHILLLNQGSTAFDKSENVTLQLCQPKETNEGSKTFSKLFIELLTFYKGLTKPELLSLGCGRAYSVAQSGEYGLRFIVNFYPATLSTKRNE